MVEWWWWWWWWWSGSDGGRIVAVCDTNATFFQPCKLMLAFKVRTQTSCHLPYNTNVSNVSAINMIHILALCLMLDHILHRAFIVFMRWSCASLSAGWWLHTFNNVHCIYRNWKMAGLGVNEMRFHWIILSVEVSTVNKLKSFHFGDEQQQQQATVLAEERRERSRKKSQFNSFRATSKIICRFKWNDFYLFF